MKTICDWNNCFEIGRYRAPVEKDNSKNFRLLCLKHMTWHKKTQSFSSSDNFFKVLWNNVLNEGMEDLNLKDKFIRNKKIPFDKDDIKAFSILGVKVGLKWDKIQQKFKKLVKKFHPDINAGDKNYEEKLKVITLAYTQLKNTYRQKIGK